MIQRTSFAISGLETDSIFPQRKSENVTCYLVWSASPQSERKQLRDCRLFLGEKTHTSSEALRERNDKPLENT